MISDSIAPFNTPVLFINFNRPNNTSRVFDQIKKRRPKYLFVFQDGARSGVENDLTRVNEVRAVLEQTLDWDCEFKTFFSDVNLGCGRGPAAAISWFFNYVEEGIILEDDCLPHLDFFDYCSELLCKYRDHESIGIIGGSNFDEVRGRMDSYRFTAYAGIWGWATWKRVWDKYDFDFLIAVSDFEKKVFPFIKSRDAMRYWSNILRRLIADTDITYWDYQLHLILLCSNSIHILPNQNLITNIGFGEDSTHTKDFCSKYSNRELQSIFPLIHPSKILIETKNDNLEFRVSLLKKITRSVKKLFVRVLK